MKHNTGKLVSFLASRHGVKQVAYQSAFPAAAGATRPVPQPMAPRSHGHTAALPGAGEITPVCTSGRCEDFLFNPPFNFYHWRLPLCSSLAKSQPSALLLLLPWHWQAGVRQVPRMQEAGFNSHDVFKQPTCILWVSLSIWISLFVAFQELAVRMRNTSPWQTKAVIHTDVPVTRLTQVQNHDPQNLGEQVQSLPCASAWPQSSLTLQKLVSSFQWPLHGRLPTSLQQDPPRGALRHTPVQGLQPYTHVQKGRPFAWEPFLQGAVGRGTQIQSPCHPASCNPRAFRLQQCTLLTRMHYEPLGSWKYKFWRARRTRLTSCLMIRALVWEMSPGHGPLHLFSHHCSSGEMSRLCWEQGQ